MTIISQTSRKTEAKARTKFHAPSYTSRAGRCLLEETPILKVLLGLGYCILYAGLRSVLPAPLEFNVLGHDCNKVTVE